MYSYNILHVVYEINNSNPLHRFRRCCQRATMCYVGTRENMIHEHHAR